MLKLTITGCTGRMGRLLLREINQSPDVELAGALTRTGNPFIGQDVGNLIETCALNIFITDDPKIAFKEADVIIDFSAPEALDRYLDEALHQKKPFAVCQSSPSEVQKEKLQTASQSIPLLMAPNTSLAVALLRKLSLLTAKVLGTSYDISILEMHHHHKKDAPSGAALSIAKDLATLEHLKHNIPPYPSLSPRPNDHLECVSIRGGSVVGDHTVIFASEKDMITLEHRALDRALFAEGAIKAAQWLSDKPKGLYTIDDVVEVSLCQPS
ncbi:MAG: 4-hydroxy-tetrahydrodipicolinate reductase [Proteobacteria bacterium]|nr:4-hydroxy-tetrahydrodipicolinate reductase [Pseudomonadota bacterium]